MSATTSPPLAAARRSVLTALLSAMSAVFVAFLVTGVAMPALPLHVHRGLGLGTFAVGLVAGSQFAASLVSRIWAGHHADTRGAKRAVVAGLLVTAAAGLIYLLSLRFVATPVASAGILLLGRAVLGGAESFVITGALGWGLALAGPGNTGKVMAWLGTAMYAAFAAGAPAGGALYAAYGFSAIALATTLVPLAVLPVVARLRAVPPQGRARPAVAQCGYCQTGQIMQAASLLKDTPNPSDDDIDGVMSGNLCRCGTYPRTRAAINRRRREGGHERRPRLRNLERQPPSRSRRRRRPRARGRARPSRCGAERGRAEEVRGRRDAERPARRPEGLCRHRRGRQRHRDLPPAPKWARACARPLP